MQCWVNKVTFLRQLLSDLKSREGHKLVFLSATVSLLPSPLSSSHAPATDETTAFPRKPLSGPPRQLQRRPSGITSLLEEQQTAGPERVCVQRLQYVLVIKPSVLSWPIKVLQNKWEQGYYFWANCAVYNWHGGGFWRRKYTVRPTWPLTGQTLGPGSPADSASGISSPPHSFASQRFVSYDCAETLLGPLAYAQESPLHWVCLFVCMINNGFTALQCSPWGKMAH